MASESAKAVQKLRDHPPLTHTMKEERVCNNSLADKYDSRDCIF